MISLESTLLLRAGGRAFILGIFTFLGVAGEYLFHEQDISKPVWAVFVSGYVLLLFGLPVLYEGLKAQEEKQGLGSRHMSMRRLNAN